MTAGVARQAACSKDSPPGMTARWDSLVMTASAKAPLGLSPVIPYT
jgi:hypothetical protein